MNSELTQRLLKRFPVLYQDYHAPMTQTCMCWGFDHRDGWFEIIWQLSLAIEEELGYSWLRERWYLFKKSLLGAWNKFIYTLSPITQDTNPKTNSIRECLPRCGIPTPMLHPRPMRFVSRHRTMHRKQEAASQISRERVWRKLAPSMSSEAEPIASGTQKSQRWWRSGNSVLWPARISRNLPMAATTIA